MTVSPPPSETPPAPSQGRRFVPWCLLLLLVLTGLLTVLGFVTFAGWPIDLLCHFRSQFVVLALLTLLGCMAARRNRLTAVALVLLLVNMLTVLVAYWPAPAPTAAPNASPLRVFHLNLEAQNYQHERALARIREEAADVVFLMEYTAHWRKALAPLEEKYPHQVLYPLRFPHDTLGLGLLSRLPVRNPRAEIIQGHGAPSVIAEVTWDGRPLTLVGTHAFSPRTPDRSWIQQLHFRVLGNFLAETGGSAALFGDLNTTPFSPVFHDFLARSGLRDSGAGGFPTPTWPNYCPLFWVPIDHCLISPDLAVLSRRVGADVGSEHYPLVVELAFATQGTQP